MNFGNEYIEYYDENTLIFSIVYTVDYQETGSSGIDAHSHTIKNSKIYLGEINTKFKKHVDYYMASASFSLGLYSRELSQFCTEMIDSKKAMEKDNEVHNESVDNTKLKVYESYSESVISKDECDYLLEAMKED